MKKGLKVMLAVAALQCFAAHAASAGGGVRDGLRASPRAAAARRASMAQRGGKVSRGKRAGDALLPGVWGGEHIRFEVTEGGANIEYDCAHGTVEGKIVVDARGRFSVAGMHYEEHSGPQRAGAEAPAYPVRLSGVVGGSLLRLRVTRAGTRKVVGNYVLGRGREAELVKCR